MTRPHLPHTTLAPLLGVIVTATLLVPASAVARLIPPPGPWPTDVAGAANPLANTQLAFNGANATPNVSLRVWLPVRGHRRSTVTRSVGQTTTLRGRLRSRDNRRAISGATLVVAVQNVYAPAAWTAVGSTRSNRRGDFTAILGPGYHRRAAVLYYPTISSPAPVFSRRLLMRARSRVALRRPFHRGRSFRFDGQVSAGIVPIPASGLTIALQVRNRAGAWVTARLTRTTPSGRFRIRYRFRDPARLAVRVVAPAQTSWPLYAGHSRRWTIHPR